MTPEQIEDLRDALVDADNEVSSAYDALADAKSALDRAFGLLDPQAGPLPDSAEFFVSPAERRWGMKGRVANWKEPILVPQLALPGVEIREAGIKMQIGVGRRGLGSTLFEFYKDSKKWKGDTILLLNLGGNDRLAASHTLKGPESVPVRTPFDPQPGDVIDVSAIYGEGQWAIHASIEGNPVSSTVYMMSPAIKARVGYGIQLGSHGDDFHETNESCEILAFEAWVK